MSKKPKGDRRKKSDRRAQQRTDAALRRAGQERRTDVSTGSSMRAEPNLTSALKTILKENPPVDEKVVDNPEPVRVDSRSLDSTSAMTSPGNDAQHKESSIMSQSSITLTRSTKDRKSTSVVFTNATLRGSVRIAKTYFPKDSVPESLTISGEFVEPKAKMTAEERKAARKNAPKLSAAEKLAKLQERAARLQKKIEAEAAAPATA